MPVEAVRSGEGVIGEHSLRDFVGLASQHLDCEHFGYLTAVDHPIILTGQLQPAKQKATQKRVAFTQFK